MNPSVCAECIAGDHSMHDKSAYALGCQRPGCFCTFESWRMEANGGDLKGIRIPVDSKVKFESEKQGYIVQASDERFAICTKPFNLRRTVLYTIIDFVYFIRGPENMVFGFGAETRTECEEMLERLNHLTEPSKVSSRHGRDLDLERVTFPDGADLDLSLVRMPNAPDEA